MEIDYIHSNKYLQRGFEYFFVFVIVEHSEVKESQYAQYVEISHIYIYIYIYIYIIYIYIFFKAVIIIMCD